jgi:hypothetical protein
LGATDEDQDRFGNGRKTGGQPGVEPGLSSHPLAPVPPPTGLLPRLTQTRQFMDFGTFSSLSITPSRFQPASAAIIPLFHSRSPRLADKDWHKRNKHNVLNISDPAFESAHRVTLAGKPRPRRRARSVAKKSNHAPREQRSQVHFGSHGGTLPMARTPSPVDPWKMDVGRGTAVT